MLQKCDFEFPARASAVHFQGSPTEPAERKQVVPQWFHSEVNPSNHVTHAPKGKSEHITMLRASASTHDAVDPSCRQIWRPAYFPFSKDLWPMTTDPNGVCSGIGAYCEVVTIGPQFHPQQAWETQAVMGPLVAQHLLQPSRTRSYIKLVKAAKYELLSTPCIILGRCWRWKEMKETSSGLPMLPMI